MSTIRDNHKVITCKTSTTFAYMVGGITSFASSFFMSKFPKGYFKKLFIIDSFNSTNMRNEDFYEQSTPYISIQPVFEVGNTFTEMQPYWQTTNYWIFRNKIKNYPPVLKDKESGINIYAVPSRVKVNFNISIKLPTVMSAYEAMHYITQNFETTGYNYINDIKLQTEIPPSYIKIIAKTLKLDVNNKEDKDKLNEFLLSHSYSGIQEIINMSTGRPSHMYNLNSNILVNYPDTATFEKNNEGAVVKDTVVKYSFSMETWIPSNYIMEVPDSNMIIDEEEDNLVDEKGNYKFNLIFKKDYIEHELDGKHLLVKKSYIPDVNVEYDLLEFEPIISEEVISVLKKLKEYNKNISNVMKAIVYINGRELSESLYDVDWDNYTLKTFHPLSNKTYTILLYGNLPILNQASDYIQNGVERKIAHMRF